MKKILSIAFVWICTFIFIMNLLGVRIAKIDGASMSPTLKDSQYVIYLKTDNYDVGDITVVNVENMKVVKRVIAKNESSINFENGKIYVNNKKLETDLKIKESWKHSYQVKNGEIFILGDNLENSYDSRTYGAISEKNIEGRVVFW